MVICDFLTGVVQSIFLSYTTSICLEDEGKDKAKMIGMALLLILISTLSIVKGAGGNNSLAVLYCHIIAIVLCSIMYKENIIKAITAYTVSYCILGAYSILAHNIIYECIESTGFPINMNNVEIIFVHVIQWILVCLFLRFKEYIITAYKVIVRENLQGVILTSSIIVDFLLIFYKLNFGETNNLLMNFTMIILFLIFVSILFYFGKINKKSQQVLALNTALESKNSDLRKIKHDYGAQISYLYGLCLMNRYDDLKSSLKNIINNNEATPDAVEVNTNNNDNTSLLSIALKPATDKGIHVILEEDCDISLINMNELELYRIVSNIINNAIRAMNGNGTIIAESYRSLNSIVIKIENNGPKIPSKYITEIFKSGFTTKKDKESNHGYGLSIVKDLVESYGGKISVKSTDEHTVFKMVFPLN